MRVRNAVGAVAVFVAGAIAGSMIAPPPADAVSREIIQIQQTVNEILQNQQDMRTDVDSRFASMQTLVQQSINASNHLNQTMGALQTTLQSAQANNGATNNSVAQQMQGVSDNIQDLQARMGKLAQQMNDMQSTLQTINAKISAGPAQSAAPANPGSANLGSAPTTPPDSSANPTASSAGASNANPATPPITAETLYANALRDLHSGHYDMSHQEFSDYLKNFPDGPFAANAQFYLGEISYAQGDYSKAIDAYDNIIVNYPKSPRVAPSMLEKGRALVQIGKKTSAAREFRELMRRFPGTDEAKKAAANLRALNP